MSRFRDKNNPKYTTLPTETDWGDYQRDLDQNSAHEMFAGHTNEEMQPRFRDNVIERTSELRFMPEIPFRYYMRGFRDFVLAGDFNGWDADAASCFLRLVAEKLENHPRHIMPIMSDLLPAIEHVAHNQAAYDADEKIYGIFPRQIEGNSSSVRKVRRRAYIDQLNAFLHK